MALCFIFFPEFPSQLQDLHPSMLKHEYASVPLAQSYVFALTHSFLCEHYDCICGIRKYMISSDFLYVLECRTVEYYVISLQGRRCGEEIAYAGACKSCTGFHFLLILYLIFSDFKIGIYGSFFFCKSRLT